MDTDNQQRREIANIYLNNINHPDIILPGLWSGENSQMTHVWHLFVVRTSKRNQLQQYLTENGIQTLIHYPIPPHEQKAYKEFNSWSFPITELIHSQVLSLPISPVMTEEEVDKVVDVVNNYNT